MSPASDIEDEPSSSSYALVELIDEIDAPEISPLNGGPVAKRKRSNKVFNLNSHPNHSLAIVMVI